jgi:hypothetical protein
MRFMLFFCKMRLDFCRFCTPKILHSISTAGLSVAIAAPTKQFLGSHAFLHRHAFCLSRSRGRCRSSYGRSLCRCSSSGERKGRRRSGSSRSSRWRRSGSTHDAIVPIHRGIAAPWVGVPSWHAARQRSTSPSCQHRLRATCTVTGSKQAAPSWWSRSEGEGEGEGRARGRQGWQRKEQGRPSSQLVRSSVLIFNKNISRTPQRPCKRTHIQRRIPSD